MPRTDLRAEAAATLEADRAASDRYAAWRARMSKRHSAFRNLIVDAIAGGEIVHEQVGPYVLDWPTCDRSLGARRSPEAYADHLLARHAGFGTSLEIRGTRYVGAAPSARPAEGG